MLDIELLIKIAVIGIGLGILHSVLKQSGKEEFAHMATLAGVIIGFLLMFQDIFAVFRTVKTLFNL